MVYMFLCYIDDGAAVCRPSTLLIEPAISPTRRRPQAAALNGRIATGYVACTFMGFGKRRETKVTRMERGRFSF